MTGFVKLYGQQLLGSSLMDEDVSTRWLFIFFCASADANGFIRCQTTSAVARMAGISYEQAEHGLQVLSSPDENSTSPDEEGRRIVRVEGGWRLVNYQKYRDRDGRPNLKTPGKVYFIRCGDAIKIGFSSNPWARINALKTSMPEDPELLGYFHGRLEDEAAFQRRFKHLHKNREWFRADPELLEAISVATGSDGRSGSATTSSSPSYSLSEESVEGGVGGDPRPPEAQVRGSNFRAAADLDVKILRGLRELEDLTGEPAWKLCRKVTSYKRPSGEMTAGVEDPSRLKSVLAREKALADLEWWLEKARAEHGAG